VHPRPFDFSDLTIFLIFDSWLGCEVGSESGRMWRHQAAWLTIAAILVIAFSPFAFADESAQAVGDNQQIGADVEFSHSLPDISSSDIETLKRLE
jgi:hypothetical protein